MDRLTQGQKPAARPSFGPLILLHASWKTAVKRNGGGFVKILDRDRVHTCWLDNAAVALKQLPRWFEDYYKHPHTINRMSPSQYQQSLISTLRVRFDTDNAKSAAGETAGMNGLVAREDARGLRATA